VSSCAGLSPLADDEDFPDVVAPEEELDGSVVAEESFDVAIVEHALQLELRPALKFQGFWIADVVAIVGSVRSRIASVEERQEDAAGFHDGVNPFDGRLYDFFGQVIGHVPRHYRVKLFAFVAKILRQEAVDVDY
jgi:hypothetical protein